MGCRLPEFLLINPHITNNAADDPLGNSWPPAQFL